MSGLCGGPDDFHQEIGHSPPPFHEDDEHLRHTRKSSISDSDSEDDSIDSSPDYSQNTDVDELLHLGKPVRITFELRLTKRNSTLWETVLSENVLYVNIPSTLPSEGSRESFTALLELTEEKLGCHSMVLCMRRDRPDRQQLMRTFMFLGFQLLAPNNKLMPPMAQDENLYLIYNIE